MQDASPIPCALDSAWRHPPGVRVRHRLVTIIRRRIRFGIVMPKLKQNAYHRTGGREISGVRSADEVFTHRPVGSSCAANESGGDHLPVPLRVFSMNAATFACKAFKSGSWA